MLIFGFFILKNGINPINISVWRFIPKLAVFINIFVLCQLILFSNMRVQNGCKKIDSPAMKTFPTMLIIFMGCLLFSSQIIWSQSAIAIETNDFVTTTIFFPSNIKKVVSPASNFRFSYEEGSNIGLLKGRSGKPSNLLVITEQGFVYSFALRFTEEVSEFNFFLKKEQAISKTKLAIESSKDSKIVGSTSNDEEVRKNKTNTPPISSVNTNTNLEPDSEKGMANNKSEKQLIVPSAVDSLPQKDLYDVDREEYYRIYCENNYLQKTSYKRSFRQNKKIAVRLNNVLTDRNEKYFILQIENNSRREYQVAGLSFFRKLDVGQLKKIMNPLYSFNLQEKIDPESVNEVVYVFKNFKISAKEKIIVVLADANSDNMVLLPLDDLLINFSSN